MKNIIVLFILFYSFVLKGQIEPDTLNQVVIASAGKTFESSNYVLTFTVGEVIIETFQSGSGKLTQGFHQPEAYEITKLFESSGFNGEIIVFPNPVSNVIKVSAIFDSWETLKFQIYDMSGKELFGFEKQLINETIELDVSQFPKGIFLLIVSNSHKTTQEFYKIIKA